MSQPTTTVSPRERLARLSPRDRDVVTALIKYWWLDEDQVAEMINMSVHNLRKRRQHAYPVLDVYTRHALVYVYRDLFPQ